VIHVLEAVHTASLKAQTKKRIAILLAVTAIALLGLIVVLSPFHSRTDWPTSEKRIPLELVAAGYRVLEIRTYAPHLITQPLHIRLSSSLAKKFGTPALGFGPLESGVQYLFESPSKVRLLCLIRHDEESVINVVIPYATNTKSDAKILRDTLTKAFPDLTITLELSPDALLHP